jgi:hypothetical protein
MSLDVYGTPTDATTATEALQSRLGMAFDGNEHAAVGRDSHYYGESERFGSILVFSNAPTLFDDAPFPQHADARTVVVAVNPSAGRELQQILLDCGFAHLNAAGSVNQR